MVVLYTTFVRVKQFGRLLLSWIGNAIVADGTLFVRLGSKTPKPFLFLTGRTIAFPSN
jgi:hypothetical protein